MKRQSVILSLSSLFIFVVLIYASPLITPPASPERIPDIMPLEASNTTTLKLPLYTSYEKRGIISPIQALQIIRDDRSYTDLFITELELKNTAIYEIEGLNSTHEYFFRVDATTGELLDTHSEREATNMSVFDGILVVEDVINKIQAMPEYNLLIITEIEFDEDDLEYDITGFTPANMLSIDVNANTGNINTFEIHSLY